MSSYIFIDSIRRDMYKYPNSADFLIEAAQTETWNMIRSNTPAMPVQASRNQYYNVKVCSLSLPMMPELLAQPGVFITLIGSKINKNCSAINHMATVDDSGFPCGTGDACFQARTLEEIAERIGKPVGELTQQEIREQRRIDSRTFYSSTKVRETTFYMVCDKLQFNEQGQAMWIQYKSCMDQALPLNWRGHDIRFRVSDIHGRPIVLNTCPECPDKCGQSYKPCTEDLWDPCTECSPANPMRQVYALLEVTYMKYGNAGKDEIVLNRDV